eukprot:2637523-Rhodomonas_salina.1
MSGAETARNTANPPRPGSDTVLSNTGGYAVRKTRSNPTPYTLHPTPYTLHPGSTLDPKRLMIDPSS